MTSITPPPDDIGLQRLKLDNAAPGTARAVTSPRPAGGVPESRPAPRQAEAETVTPVERRQGERRHGERRQRNLPVVLDTRSRQDRRTRTGQRATDHEPGGETTVRRGIDVEV